MDDTERRKIDKMLDEGETMASIFSDKDLDPRLQPRNYAAVDSNHAAIWAGYHRLPRDMNGCPLVSEETALLDREHITDDGERGLFLHGWQALESERATVAAEDREAASKKGDE